MRSINTGLNNLIKDLIRKECHGLKSGSFITENSFSVGYNINMSRVNPLFYELEKEGFFKKNNIDITYYEGKFYNKPKLYKIYLKR